MFTFKLLNCNLYFLFPMTQFSENLFALKLVLFCPTLLFFNIYDYIDLRNLTGVEKIFLHVKSKHNEKNTRL